MDIESQEVKNSHEGENTVQSHEGQIGLPSEQQNQQTNPDQPQIPAEPIKTHMEDNQLQEPVNEPLEIEYTATTQHKSEIDATAAQFETPKTNAQNTAEQINLTQQDQIKVQPSTSIVHENHQNRTNKIQQSQNLQKIQPNLKQTSITNEKSIQQPIQVKQPPQNLQSNQQKMGCFPTKNQLLQEVLIIEPEFSFSKIPHTVDSSSDVPNEKQKSPTQNGLNSKIQSNYKKSLDQIDRILKDKTLSKQPFIQEILGKFNPIQSNEDNEEIDLNKQITENVFDREFVRKLGKDKEIISLFENNVIFHARIMYVLYRLTHSDAEVSEQPNIDLSSGLRKLQKEFLRLKIKASLNEKLWTLRKKFQSSYRTWQRTSYRTTREEQTENIDEQIDLEQLRKNDLFLKIEAFLKELKFNDKNHQFNRKMPHLTQESYKLRYLEEFSFYSFRDTQQIERFLQGNKKCDRFNNIMFYLNKQKASYSRLNLNDIQTKKVKDYDWLQRTHDYIQWLFPNHFQSNFNSDSFALGYVQAEIFCTSKHLLEKILKSFTIYLDFMGCEIRKKQGQVTVKLIDTQNENIRRLKDCLIYNTHNHLRIMRILACLSIVGLRQYAEAFLTFLNDLYTNGREIISSWKLEHPLQTMWNLYSSQSEKKKKALEMCFLPQDEFPEYIDPLELMDRLKNSQQKGIYSPQSLSNFKKQITKQQRKIWILSRKK